MTPIATITNNTATGDVIVGPGNPTYLVKGLPVACQGDAVSGPTVVGTITSTTCTNILMKGRPVANMGSVVTGTNPMTGAPMTTSVVVCPTINYLL